MTAVVIDGQPTVDQGACGNDCSVFANNFAKLEQEMRDIKAMLSSLVNGRLLILANISTE